MATFSIQVKGMARALKATEVYGAGAAEANGPIAAWSSDKPYARFIETGRSSRQVRRAGPARMFERGVADTAREVPAVMGPAIVKGPNAVGGARRSIQRKGVTNIRKYTPVVSGALRDSIRPVSRPRGTR
jgi:hypothetical protein